MYINIKIKVYGHLVIYKCSALFTPKFDYINIKGVTKIIQNLYTNTKKKRWFVT